MKAEDNMNLPKELSWIPKRTGDVYCSSACGAKCKHKWYLAAKKNAKWLCKQLPGFKPHVHENMGWFWSAYNGDVAISQAICKPRGIRTKVGYIGRFNGAVLSDGSTPKAALKELLKYMERRAMEYKANVFIIQAVLRKAEAK